MQYETMHQVLKDLRGSDALADLCTGELSQNICPKALK